MKRDQKEYLTLKPKIQTGLLELMNSAQDDRNTLRFDSIKKVLGMVNEAYDCLARNITDKDTLKYSHEALLEDYRKLNEDKTKLKADHIKISKENDERLALLKKLFLIDPTLANKVSKSDITKIFGEQSDKNPVLQHYYNLKRVA